MTSSDFSQNFGSDFKELPLIPNLTLTTHDPVRSPLLHDLLSPHSAPPTPVDSLGLHFQILHPFRWSSARRERLDFHLSPCGVNITGLQDSLYVTDCGFDITSLHHTRSPRCSGGCLHSDLTPTMIELSSMSKSCLFKAHL